MSRQHPDLRAQTITDSTSGKAYYVLVKLLEDKIDFEESSIDVRITDGASCWEIEGVRRQPAPKDWLRNVHSALSGSSQGTYEIQVQSSPDDLRVIIRWHEAALRVRASVSLPAAKDASALPSMLDTLFRSFAVMQEAYTVLAASEAQLSSRADSSQAQLQKLVDAREKREQELYIKFAAVVNEKKQKLRELQQRVQELEQQAEDDPAEENGSGAGSPPRLTAEAEHDSVYDAETEPSANESEAQKDLEDTYQTQRRPAAGTFGVDETPASQGRLQSQVDGKAPTTRSQAERDALLAAETQPLEPDQDQDGDQDQDMHEAHAQPIAAPQDEPAPEQRPPAKPGGLAKRRRR